MAEVPQSEYILALKTDFRFTTAEREIIRPSDVYEGNKRLVVEFCFRFPESISDSDHLNLLSLLDSIKFDIPQIHAVSSKKQPTTLRSGHYFHSSFACPESSIPCIFIYLFITL